MNANKDGAAAADDTAANEPRVIIHEGSSNNLQWSEQETGRVPYSALVGGESLSGRSCLGGAAVDRRNCQLRSTSGRAAVAPSGCGRVDGAALSVERCGCERAEERAELLVMQQEALSASAHHSGISAITIAFLGSAEAGRRSPCIGLTAGAPLARLNGRPSRSGRRL